mgnify:CR=1 FL=1
MIIKKEDVEKLSRLSRVALSEEEKISVSADLEKILAHFEELKELNTDGVLPVLGGGEEKNILRNDEDEVKVPSSRDALIRAFPERDGDFLKVPAVFGS